MCPKTASPKLPKTAAARLKPYIDRGITNGIFPDGKVVTELYYSKAASPELQENISNFGGKDTPIAQDYITDVVLVDLSALLNQKRYTAHLDIWEVAHRTVGLNSGNPRPAVFIMGQGVLETDDAVLDEGLFRLQLWDNDVSIADDLERDGHYISSVSCRNLDNDVLDLKVLSGLTRFESEKYEHGSREELLRSMYDVTPIAELEDDISRGFNDYRLIEATVAYSGVKNSRAGNQFGSLMLKDESTMTIEAIESGENLLLNALCSVSVANRFGKYSRLLCLATTRTGEQYGLSANIEATVGLVVIEPPKPTVTTGGDDDEDDAADYFSTSNDDIPLIEDDEDEDDGDEDAPTKESDDPKPEPEPEPEVEEVKVAEPKKADADTDDEWDDWDED
tara:strand:- start:217 stop:1395 length:1179 start_codon:yes stop_codon:yes gene_type:complete